MTMRFCRALCATTALTTSLLFGGEALAQSTGTSVVEELVVTGTLGPKTIDGTMLAETEPKSRASITEELIGRQSPGQTILDAINLLPAVNFTNNDAFGSAGGDFTIRGFDSQRVALLQDGVPLNDSGNYAVFPHQQLEPDLIARATVNLGTTDVDSPTAAAAGGTINYITKKASKEFGVRAEVAAGSSDFQRYYGTIESGAIGPFGTRLWVSGLYTRNDLFTPRDATVKPNGKIQKKQFNARIDQDFGDYGWASLIFNYNQNRNNFINRISLANYQARIAPVNGLTCVRPTPAAGTAQLDTVAACPGNYFDFNINPSNTGNIRGLSSWKLTDAITLTVDPSFQYVLANGGGAQIYSEKDAQLRGNTAAAGVDVNGDGDILDSVYLYRPNTTNTRRYGVTSSLIWKLGDNQSVRAAYTFDRAKHRQTGDVGVFDANGAAESVFGGKDGHGAQVKLPDGTNLRRRDRASVALLNQFSIEYRARLFDEKLLLNAGLRAPFFKRQLNNFCYQRDTFNAFCTTQIGIPIAGTDDGAGKPLVTFPSSALNPSAANRYGQPRAFERKYDKVLPNLGASYEVNDDLTVFASYAETLSAPRTDDLYDQVLVDPGPERAKAYDLGFRFQRRQFMAAGAVWRNEFSNRIERVFDDQSGIAFSSNVGDVKLWGVDGQVAFRPVETISVYGSASYIRSEIQNDIKGTNLGQVLATKGKALYETPKLQGGVRVQWTPSEDLSVGLQGKWVGGRWTNLVNTERFPSYSLWDLDARFKLDRFGLKDTYIQANVRNLLNERYLGDITTNLTGTGLGQPGYRRTFILEVHAEY